MVVIDIENLQNSYPIETIPLGQWANQVLDLLEIGSAEISVVIVDNDQIQELNRTYLGHDRPTNVISFPQQEGEGPDGEHLGDVVISIEMADQEAKEAGLSLSERMLQLLIHGICHLAGFDHERGTEEEARKMEETEEGLYCRIMEQKSSL